MRYLIPVNFVILVLYSRFIYQSKTKFRVEQCCGAGAGGAEIMFGPGPGAGAGNKF